MTSNRAATILRGLADRLHAAADRLHKPTTGQWQDRAACGPLPAEAFFPEKGGSTREAKKVCQGCPVRLECLDHAQAHGERFGVWGGLTERERRNLHTTAAAMS